MAEPRIIVLTAPSGAGKSTIAKRVMETMPQLRFSVSATTRAPRSYEQDGEHYHFLSEDEFRRRIEEDEILEYEEVYPGRLYGTLRSEVDRATRAEPVLLDIDVKGARNVKKSFGPEALVVFVKPPSLEALAERLRGRGTETDETLHQRLTRAEMEIQQADQFDAIVVNDRLPEAVDETLRLIHEFLNS